MMTWRLAVGCFACAWVALSQTSRGTVTGTVLDGSGAVVPKARIHLTGLETGAQLATDSNKAGVYRFDAIDLGVYDLKVTHAGFRTYVGTGISIEANRVITLDFRLEPGTADTRIEVSADSSDALILRVGKFVHTETPVPPGIIEHRDRHQRPDAYIIGRRTNVAIECQRTR